jgi:hypothetical protein
MTENVKQILIGIKTMEPVKHSATGALGLGGRDSVFIDPDGNVWVQRPDGSWSNEGPASDYTGSGKASGRRGKDRDKRNCP